MKKLIHMLSVLLCISLVPAANSRADEREKRITLGKNDWSSQVVITHALQHLLQAAGYRVSSHYIKVDQQWDALASGALNVQMEVWQGSMAQEFERRVAAGRIIDAGSHNVLTREEWWYPAYVAALCPGLPDWHALQRCSGIFAIAETAPLGAYISGPWEKNDEARIRALGLPFKVVHLSIGPLLWKKLKNAQSKQSPILLFNWSPNWVEQRIPGSFIEFPDYSPKCATDPLWGINPEAVMDCGNPKNGYLKKAVSTNFPKQWPCANRFINAFNLDNAMVAEAAALLDYDKLSLEDAAQRWLLKYKKTWQSWVPADCMAIP